jgi:hypothetical protein
MTTTTRRPYADIPGPIPADAAETEPTARRAFQEETLPDLQKPAPAPAEPPSRFYALREYTIDAVSPAGYPVHLTFADIKLTTWPSTSPRWPGSATRRRRRLPHQPRHWRRPTICPRAGSCVRSTALRCARVISRIKRGIRTTSARATTRSTARATAGRIVLAMRWNDAIPCFNAHAAVGDPDRNRK